tara:strand:- start:110 stop:517 length:408 start_codon:yes stop_codon:yes gene_type:complete
LNKIEHNILPSSNIFTRWLWLILGLLLTAIGLIGIVVPGLPTTIFMILAAACYFRSSQGLYNWVINHKYFGSHVKNYREGKGMPLRAKVLSLSMMWIFVFYAIFFALATKLLALKIIVFLAASIGTRTILNLPTR